MSHSCFRSSPEKTLQQFIAWVPFGRSVASSSLLSNRKLKSSNASLYTHFNHERKQRNSSKRLSQPSHHRDVDLCVFPEMAFKITLWPLHCCNYHSKTSRAPVWFSHGSHTQKSWFWLLPHIIIRCSHDLGNGKRELGILGKGEQVFNFTPSFASPTTLSLSSLGRSAAWVSYMGSAELLAHIPSLVRRESPLPTEGLIQYTLLWPELEL